ncbi:trihelix transcription factor ASR3 isoform X2 [Beta vulgaris subsp. vulgaris]|uniref:trihelix transcription factor ASR3 isoform X2 n=1 Tax=Beta vulgaris subsp. vulgaris TaxID=3555 RepID=UPI00053F335A|nr:trihelix transcription factor ASR3 isoform X2 [Beta vulgaris subsp. vulgaris]
MSQRGGQGEEEDEEVMVSMTSKAVVSVDFNHIVTDNNVDEGSRGGVGKAARLPRWTRQEILVLIQGKKVAENRVRRGRTGMLCEGQGQGVVQVEPKWATVSSYCKRHGVNRGPVQCRKRWSNLAGDFKKIKEWESHVKDESDSFWLMRNDLRRDRKLPGFFDREVFDILNNSQTNTPTTATTTATTTAHFKSGADSDLDADADTDDMPVVEALFDSGRTAGAHDGLFSDFEYSTQRQRQRQRSEQQDDNEVGVEVGVEVEPEPEPEPELEPGTETGSASLFSPTIPIPIPAPTPISGTNNEKHRVDLDPEMGSTSHEGRKRRRFSEEDDADGAPDHPIHLQDPLLRVLEKNGRILSSQLEAYNINMKLDREERKDHAANLVAVLNKLADALGRVADKL